MLGAKPIIYAIDAPNNPISESGAGFSCEPENAMEISSAINSLGSMTLKDRIEMGMKGRYWIVNNRDYRVLAEQFLESL